MANMVSCDRCHDTAEPCTKGWYSVTVKECEGGGNFWNKPYVYDLCPSCAKEVARFIENGTTDEQRWCYVTHPRHA